MIRRRRSIDQRLARLGAAGSPPGLAKPHRFLAVAFSRLGLLAFFLLALGACGGGAAAPPPTPTLAPALAEGQRVFVAHCGACHSTAPDTVIVGPSLAGIAQRGGQRVDGLDARAYVYGSILQPGDFLVPGFEDLMPHDLAKKLTGEELDRVVEYVLNLESGIGN